jgi:hypothetical protein
MGPDLRSSALRGWRWAFARRGHQRVGARRDRLDEALGGLGQDRDRPRPRAFLRRPCRLLEEAREKRLAHLLHHGDEQRVAIGEVHVERTTRVARAIADGVQARRVEAFLREELERRGDERLARLLLGRVARYGSGPGSRSLRRALWHSHLTYAFVRGRSTDIRVRM